MAAVSYDRPITINCDWGVDNLKAAIKVGHQLNKVSDENIKEFIANSNISDSFAQKFNNRFGAR